MGTIALGFCEKFTFGAVVQLKYGDRIARGETCGRLLLE
jgi:hypothetical protein